MSSLPSSASSTPSEPGAARSTNQLHQIKRAPESMSRSMPGLMPGSMPGSVLGSRPAESDLLKLEEELEGLVGFGTYEQGDGL